MLKKAKAEASSAQKTQAKNLSRAILDSSHQIWLAGLGAFSKAQQEGMKVFDTLVKQGESVEAKTRAAASQTAEAARDAAKAKAAEMQAKQAASLAAAIPAVRRALVEKQRAIGASSSVVMEGRDIGSVVFPEADVKIFLDADPEERIRRRLAETKDAPETVAEPPTTTGPSGPAATGPAPSASSAVEARSTLRKRIV